MRRLVLVESIIKAMSKKAIPEKFWKGEESPQARTVGQLVDLLAELPRTMRVEASFGAKVQVIVWNHGTEDEHVSIDSADI